MEYSTHEWLNEILEAAELTDGIDNVEWTPKVDDSAILRIKYGQENFECEVVSWAGESGVDYDGNIFDLTTHYQWQTWIAGELYMRLQKLKEAA